MASSLWTRRPGPAGRIRLILALLTTAALLGSACRGGRATPMPSVSPVVETPTAEAEEPTPSATSSPSPTPPAATRAPTATATVAPTATPIPGPDEQIVTLRPAAVDVGWWTNEELRGYLGDSFLYAGSAEGSIFISAFKLNLEDLPRGARVREATLELTGLREDRFRREAGGLWAVQFIDTDAVDPATFAELGRATFQQLYNAPVGITLLPLLDPEEMGRGKTNRWALDPSGNLKLTLQIATGSDELLVRLLGPAGGADTLFAWDSGAGPASAGNAPTLRLVLGPGPATPLPDLPTVTPVVVTLTPTPENVQTRAAEALRATTIATTVGTYTPAPTNIATPTPTPPLAENVATAQAVALREGLPPIVEPTEPPANGATATALAEYATAVALTTGTFTPVPPNAVTPMVVTPTPGPENVLTAAAQRPATGEPERTPLPYNAVVATLTPTPFVVTNTPAPANQATAVALVQYATAVALTTGTFTPEPPNMVTATPVPRASPVPLVQSVDALTPTATPSPTATPPSEMPAELVGKILFVSDRPGPAAVYALDPVSGELAQINERWPYELAQTGEGRSPDGRLTALVRNDNRGVPQVHVYDPEYDVARQLTHTTGWSFDPAWSPLGDRIVYVSQDPGNDEIFTVQPDGSQVQRLTRNDWEWDKHPSWSPDGNQIVFWSNRETGRAQLWIMESDGSNQRLLLNSPFNDKDPIWVKSTTPR